MTITLKSCLHIKNKYIRYLTSQLNKLINALLYFISRTSFPYTFYLRSKDNKEETNLLGLGKYCLAEVPILNLYM